MSHIYFSWSFIIWFIKLGGIILINQLNVGEQWHFSLQVNLVLKLNPYWKKCEQTTLNLRGEIHMLLRYVIFKKVALLVIFEFYFCAVIAKEKHAYDLCPLAVLFIHACLIFNKHWWTTCKCLRMNKESSQYMKAIINHGIPRSYKHRKGKGMRTVFLLASQLILPPIIPILYASSRYIAINQSP